jgi:hypothetical protein
LFAGNTSKAEFQALAMDINGSTIGARPLAAMCLTVIRKNINNVTDLGTLGEDNPKFALKILRLIKRPEQLAVIEQNSPQLIPHTHEIWFSLIKKEIPGWENMLFHKSRTDGHTFTEEEVKQKCSYNIFKRCQKKADEAERRAEEVLRQQIETAKQASARKETRILTTMPSTASRRSRPVAHSELRFSHGSKTKNIITKIRRETADAKLKKGRLGTPTHLLNVRQRMLPPGHRAKLTQARSSSTVKSAPRSSSHAAPSISPATRYHQQQHSTREHSPPSSQAISFTGSPGHDSPPPPMRERLVLQPSPLVKSGKKRAVAPTVLLPMKRAKR